MKQLASCRLYGIYDLAYLPSLGGLEILSRMLDGGVDIVQVRAKGTSLAEIEAISREVVKICRPRSIPVIINDHPQLVPLVGAQGAHIGQEDMSVREARELAGAGAWIGKSTHSLDQAETAAREGADCIGFGPLFATPTKPDYTPIGLEDVAEVHRNVSIPIFCIGGIKRENLGRVISAGARRAVIVSGILQAADVTAYCRDCLKLLEN